MINNSRPDRLTWLSAAVRRTYAFTAPYKPAPLSFCGQLWAALARSTPAFTGRKACIRTPGRQREDSTFDMAITMIVTPTFLNRERADSFGCERGRVLALTLARDRKLGLTLAREFARNCAEFLAGIFGYDSPHTLRDTAIYDDEEFGEFYCFVEQAHTLALALDRVLARDLNREHSYLRALKRYRFRAAIRNHVWAFIRARTIGQSKASHPVHIRTIEKLLKFVGSIYHAKSPIVVSKRARDISLELAVAIDRLGIPYTQATQLSVGLHQNLASTDLRGADLPGVQLAFADLHGGNCSTAHLSKANLSDIDLSGAHLIGTDLTGADLCGARLNGTDLSDANLKAADLSYADMTDAEPSGVVWSKLTMWPAAFEREIWARSTEIEPGVYRVDEGGERSPLRNALPTHH